jgi:hypothetical protein
MKNDSDCSARIPDAWLTLAFGVISACLFAAFIAPLVHHWFGAAAAALVVR